MSADLTGVAGVLATAARRAPESMPFGPPDDGLALLRLDDWPPGRTTWVTTGLSRRAYTTFRGLDVGWELVLTLLDTTDADLVEQCLQTLRSTVLEDDRRARERDRRPAVEANGISAPGYPPHLVLTDVVLPPTLRGRKKVGERYVSFLAAVPVGDAELRAYDRSPAAFVGALGDDTATYPRPAPT